MKNIRTALLILLPALLAASILLAADRPAQLYVNGRALQARPVALVHNGTAYAPLRLAAEAVGAHVTWNAKARQAIVCTDNQCVPIHENQCLTVKGALYLPVRSLAEALGREVRWDAAANAVRISGGKRGLL